LSVAHGGIRLLLNFRLGNVLFRNGLTFLVFSVVSNFVSNNLDVNTGFGLFTPVALAATCALFFTLKATSARDMVIVLSLATGCNSNK